MNILIVYLGFFYILIGTIFLLVPLVYLELGKPKDLIKSLLNLLIGFLLIFKNKSIDQSLSLVFLLLTILSALYVVELFLFRWNQLTDKEKSKLTTFLEFRKNLAKILEAFNLGFFNSIKHLNFFNIKSNNEKLSSKKWVRNDKNDNIKV